MNRSESEVNRSGREAKSEPSGNEAFDDVREIHLGGPAETPEEGLAGK